MTKSSSSSIDVQELLPIPPTVISMTKYPKHIGLKGIHLDLGTWIVPGYNTIIIITISILILIP